MSSENNEWPKEHDCLPLKLRLKLLHSNNNTRKHPLSHFDDKNEDQQCDFQKGQAVKVSDPAWFAMKEENKKLLQEESHDGKEKTDYYDNRSTNLVANSIKFSPLLVGQVAKSETVTVDDSFDDLDHIVLKERRKLLLSRKFFEFNKSVSEGNCSSLSNKVGCVTIQNNHGIVKKKNSSSHIQLSNGEHSIDNVPERNFHDFCEISKFASSTGNTMIGKSNEICSPKSASTSNKTGTGHEFACGTPENLFSTVISGMSSNLKVEPMEHDDAPYLDMGVVGTLFSNDGNMVKSEFPEDSYHDEVDHILLSDRIKLMASKETSNISRAFKSSKKIISTFLDTRPVASEFTPLRINRSRKRKTVTDSIETAMEEDAPGLLKVLLDKGVSINEIKLYGVGENDESSDGLEESFSALEAVMSKIFFQRQSFLKLGSLRCMKDEKPSYCLACLESLVEQARYLQFRKWPVEWGWCRDLQSFIFVFERHHRIVLERPEYGYATYFFELVDFLTIDWQIKRLVTVMKLASCGRITLIENRSLVVGEDITEGEARVLMVFGWTPSTGLGTMLNYRDRVIHDHKNESNSSEWKSKIGKLLMDGYNGGTLVSPQIETSVVESSGGEVFQVKLEI